jgi:hypothetical protein
MDARIQRQLNTDCTDRLECRSFSFLQLSLDLWNRWYQHADAESVRFGRRQGAVLRAHGFTPVWSGASFVNHSADAATRRETVADAKRSLEALRHDLIDKGLAKDS